MKRFKDFILFEEAEEPQEETTPEPAPDASPVESEPVESEPADTGGDTDSGIDTGGDFGGDAGFDAPDETGGFGDDTGNVDSEIEQEEKVDFLENPLARAKSILELIEKKITYWFKFGKLSKFKLIDCNINDITPGAPVYLVIRFNKSKYFLYVLNIIIRPEDLMKEEITENIFLELKRIHFSDLSVTSQWSEKIEIKKLKEEYILKIIKKLLSKDELEEEPKNKKEFKKNSKIKIKEVDV